MALITLFESDDISEIVNGHIVLPHLPPPDERVVMYPEPQDIPTDRQKICRDWAQGCVFYRDGKCIFQTQEGYDKVLPLVDEATEALQKEKHPPKTPRTRNRYRVNKIVLGMVRRKMLPLQQIYNGRVEVACPRGVVKGDVVFVNNYQSL